MSTLDCQRLVSSGLGLKNIPTVRPVMEFEKGACHPVSEGLSKNTPLRPVRGPHRRAGDVLSSHVHHPVGTGSRSPVLICVHGIQRRASEQFKEWTPMADRLGMSLVAPLFEHTLFPGYQRLGSAPGSPKADDALMIHIQKLREAGRIGSGPVFLFGYSGGAQFVHRLLFVHPSFAKGAIIAAAGWYTFPDRVTPFPYGLGPSQQRKSFHLDAFLRIPLLVAVGSEDHQRDRQFRSKAWMDQWQGRNRIERAQRWIEALETTARRHGIPTEIQWRCLPGAGHSFLQCIRAGLAEHAEQFLAGKLLSPAQTLQTS